MNTSITRKKYWIRIVTARCNAQHGIATASRQSACLSVTLRYRGHCHIRWSTSKIISWLIRCVVCYFLMLLSIVFFRWIKLIISLGVHSLRTPTSRIYSKGKTPEILAGIWVGYGKKWLSAYKGLVSLKRTKVTIKDQQEVPYALSIGANINDLRWPWRVIMHSVSSQYAP